MECQISQLPHEALDWLDFSSQDLAWIHSKWRIWESPAEEHELNAEDRIDRRVFERNGWEWNPPIKKRSVDVVRFASKRDAIYFKLMFL